MLYIYAAAVDAILVIVTVVIWRRTSEANSDLERVGAYIDQGRI